MATKDELAQYINDLFVWMAQDRKDILEPQMRRSYDAWRGRYDSEYLKKWKATEGAGWKSKVFVRITKQKVMAVYNQMMGVSSQYGGMPWDMKPSAIPNMAIGEKKEAKTRNDLMKRVLKDDFKAGNADRNYNSACLEAAIYGWSWLRGPVLRTERRAVIIPDFGVQIQNVKIPKLEYPGIWNMFWDIETEDKDKGAGIIFREFLGRGRFMALKEQPGYDKEAIQEVADGLQTEEEETGGRQENDEGPIKEQFNNRKRVIPVYRFWGRVPRRYVEGKADLTGVDGADVEIFCVVAGTSPMRVIYETKVAILPYRPVFRAKWQDLPGEAQGLGVPEDMMDSQDMVNSITRSVLDNKSISSNIMMGWNPRHLAPGQNKSIFPGKVWELGDYSEDIRQSIQFFSPQDNTGNSMQMIEMFRDFAEAETGVSEGMSGIDTPGNMTAYQTSKLAEAGNKAIGSIIRNIDEGFIKPAVTGFYHYQMLTNPNPAIKGDFSPEAKGFQGYIDRERTANSIMGLMQFAMSNDMTANFVKYLPAMREWAAAQDLDPDEMIITDDEHQQMQQQQQAQALMQQQQELLQGQQK